MAEVRFQKVVKRFKDAVVIRDLDLTIKDGEFFTFVGPSGCGKSTILNMIAGLEPLSGGDISFDGLSVEGLSPKDRDVAMVFQSYALYPHMTVFENMAFPLRMKRADGEVIRGEVQRIAELLGIGDLLKRKPKDLSGGQRQRVALGRAIIRKPKVFLMDEPLSNLDARLRVEMRAELKKLHSELKITTVYVTHDQAEAMSLSERIAVLNEGELQQCDTPVTVYSRPENIFVAGFIGSPPMNFVPAAIVRAEPPLIHCNGTALSFPVSLHPSLDTGKYPGREGRVLVGIRPEEVAVFHEKSEHAIEVAVSVIEPAGSFDWVDVLWNNVKVKGISKAGTALKTGERAFMSFPADKALLFDAVSGVRVP